MLTNNATTWRLQAHLHFLNCACWTIMPHVFHQRPSLDTDSYWASHLGPCWISCKRTWQSSGINFSLCPLLLVNQKITFRKPHNFDKWTMPASMLGTDGSVGWHWKQFAWLVWIMSLAQEAVCVDHELGTGSSVCGSWTWHRKQCVWIMNLAQEAACVDHELNMPNVQFIKINSHDSVWFFSVRFHLEGGKWHLCDLPSKYWGKRHLLRWKTAALLVSSCQFMKNLKKRREWWWSRQLYPEQNNIPIPNRTTNQILNSFFFFF